MSLEKPDTPDVFDQIAPSAPAVASPPVIQFDSKIDVIDGIILLKVRRLLPGSTTVEEIVLPLDAGAAREIGTALLVGATNAEGRKVTGYVSGQWTVHQIREMN